jgi:hypothetical protein
MIGYDALADLGRYPLLACPVQCAIAAAFHEVLPDAHKHELTKFLPRLIQADDEDIEVTDARFEKMGDDIAFVYVPMLCSFARAIHPHVPLIGMVGTEKQEISKNCMSASEACNKLGLRDIGAGFDAAYFAAGKCFYYLALSLDIWRSLKFPCRVLKVIGRTIERQPPEAKAWCYSLFRKAMNETMESLLGIGKQANLYSLREHEIRASVLVLLASIKTTDKWN